MELLMLTKKRVPLLLALICLVEVSIYLWSAWTSTLEEGNFFAIHSEFIFDKCARLAGRVSSFLILLILLMVGHIGLKKIYANSKTKDSFLILMTLFTVNHLTHLLYVFLRFRSHGETITFDNPTLVGGNLHGLITFITLTLMPFMIWSYQKLNKFVYFGIILYLFNISVFIVQTFLGKIQPPEHPAYHNQFGVLVMVAACYYVIYRFYMENIPGKERTELR